MSGVVRALFANWEGGGHVAPAIMVARQLKAMGGDILFLSDEANRGAVEAAGLSFQPWRTAPNRLEAAAPGDPLDDWRAVTPIGQVRGVLKAVMTGPALAYARDTLEAIDAFRPDGVVANELLLGVMAAAEVRGLPLAIVTGNPWSLPTWDAIPPLGPAFPPARSRWEREREATARRWIAGLYDMGREALNGARASLGLSRLDHCLDQTRRAGLILMGTARAFDFASRDPEPPFAYAGPLVPPPDPDPDPALTDPGDPRPLALVSFSTTRQNQGRAYARTIAALKRSPFRAIVTTGPSIDPADLPVAENVRVVRHAPHGALLGAAALMICHGGHGTVMRGLMAGVPLLILPFGRDQPENARRVTARGAGLTLSSRAPAGAIRRAVRRLHEDRRFTEAAAALGGRVRAEWDGGRSAAARIMALFQADGAAAPVGVEAELG